MRNIKNFSLCVFLLILLVVTTSVGLEYEIVDLGTLGGWQCRANGINNSGQVVGFSYPISGPYHAFLWTESGGMKDLGTLGGQQSYARRINDSGQVVGESRIASGENHAFLWTESGGMKDLGTLGGISSTAKDINNSGQVVGVSYTASGERHAFLWTESGGMKDLGTLGGWSDAWGINDLGQVVGWSVSSSGSHAFLWTESDGMIDIDTRVGGSSLARSINNLGQVVGWNGSAFLWTETGGMIYLSGGEAFDINDSGQVVGWSDYSSGEMHAFLWTESGGVKDLSTLGGQPSYSMGHGINESGQVAGFYTISGEEHACMWIPVNVTPTTTVITYTGDLSEPMLYPADLSATLVDEVSGVGISGQTIVFTIGSQSVAVTTLTDGSCSASLTMNQLPGSYTVTASYAGNANYQPSSDSDTFQITDPLIITPSGYDFGDVVIGTSSNAIISISGNVVTPDISSISIIGSPAFSVTTMPSLPVAVPLDLNIAFTPTLEGYDSAILSIVATSSHTTSTITYDVPLQGVGIYADALIDILGDTITPKSRWIKCQIWPPDGYSYADIDMESILLEWQIPVDRYSFNERKQKLTVMFPASSLNLVPSPDPIELTVSGELTDGTMFEGSDFVTVVSKGGKKKTPSPLI